MELFTNSNGTKLFYKLNQNTKSEFLETKEILIRLLRYLNRRFLDSTDKNIEALKFAINHDLIFLNQYK